ncbi:MAG TPA: UDP-2,3-diacylglucosamine diphosphatase [Alphaproteobacteria bacterium]|nr:UDP-2,3-diacylglucosamine hydrolase [Rhodospirillaceae bacterium]HRJ12158.1 UDP-2,3-diacylglucosamine diphosphatase [Alphaproteobacteria bacterium]
MSNELPARQFRAVWISDVHLGARECQAARLAEFLQQVETPQLYLVGDIVDTWKLRRRWYWPSSHNAVFTRIMKMEQLGTAVILMPGNHDEMLRDYLGMSFGNVKILDDTIHTTLDGRRFLVIHGDQFDDVIIHAKWLAFIGERAYTIAIYVNQAFNYIRRKMGFAYWSLSAYLKQRVKAAAVRDYREKLVRAAQDRKLDGVICGHTHFAEITDINGIFYMNDGDWVESCTALVEHLDGRLEIIDFRPTNQLQVAV